MLDNDLYSIPDFWKCICAKCSRDGLKRNMNTLYIKEPGGTMKKMCHICNRCLASLLDELEVSI